MTSLELAICNYLRENGIYQKDLASQLGVSAVDVSHWVNGSRSPNAEIKQKLLALPGFSLAAARAVLCLTDVDKQTTAAATPEALPNLNGGHASEQTTDATKPEALPYDMRNRVRDHLLCLTGFLEGLNARENSEIIGSQIDATLRLIEVLEE